jgi:hypothetical protein
MLSQVVTCTSNGLVNERSGALEADGPPRTVHRLAWSQRRIRYCDGVSGVSGVSTGAMVTRPSTRRRVGAGPRASRMHQPFGSTRSARLSSCSTRPNFSRRPTPCSTNSPAAGQTQDMTRPALRRDHRHQRPSTSPHQPGPTRCVDATATSSVEITVRRTTDSDGGRQWEAPAVPDNSVGHRSLVQLDDPSATSTARA